ncbi:MAG: tetratricopeptide (TPR) repeat protein [Glaciecola sp.]|jgi:tetratricopeptide (TPR) repeat protein
MTKQHRIITHTKRLQFILISSTLSILALSSLSVEVLAHETANIETSSLQQANSAVSKAKALNAQGKFKEAFALLDAAPKNKNTYAAMITNLANIDMDEAEETADDAIKAFPNDAQLHYLRGVIMGNQAQSSIFSALGYAEKSLNSFIKATELDPEKIQYKKALMSFYLAAPSIAGGDKELGLEQVEAIQQLDAMEGASSRVAYYQMIDEPDKAIKGLQKAIIVYPNEINFVFRLAAFYAQQEDYDKAMPLFQQAAKMPEPEYMLDELTGDAEISYLRNASARLNALYQVGRTAVVTEKDTNQGLAAMGELQAAVEVSKLEADNMPNMEWAKARIAELYLQSGDKNTASNVLASIIIEDNKDLKKQVNKLRKTCKC